MPCLYCGSEGPIAVVYNNAYPYCENCSPPQTRQITEIGAGSGISRAETDYTVLPERSFGIELEVAYCPKYETALDKHIFGAKYDGSITEGGMEFFSPVLYGDRGLEAVSAFCTVANQMKWRVDSSCGFHLHVGLAYCRDQHLNNILYSLIRAEDAAMSVVPQTRRHSQYCKRFDEDFFENYYMVADKSFRAMAGCGRLSRKYWANVKAYARHQTLELRHHSATLNYEKIENWVRLWLTFVNKCRNLVFEGGDLNDFLDFIGEDDLKRFYLKRAEKFNAKYPVRS